MKNNILLYKNIVKILSIKTPILWAFNWLEDVSRVMGLFAKQTLWSYIKLTIKLSDVVYAIECLKIGILSAETAICHI